MDKYWLGHWRCLIHGTVQRDESATSLNDFSERVCQEMYRETRTRLPLHVVQVSVCKPQEVEVTFM